MILYTGVRAGDKNNDRQLTHHHQFPIHQLSPYGVLFAIPILNLNQRVLIEGYHTLKTEETEFSSDCHI